MVNWGNAILVAVLGLATVFAVLIIIMIALMIMTKIFAPTNTVKKEEKPKITTPPPADKQEPVKNSDDSELVAVIAAAIASYLDKPVSSLKIKSYRRLGEAKSSWGSISRKENIYKGF